MNALEPRFFACMQEQTPRSTTGPKYWWNCSRTPLSQEEAKKWIVQREANRTTDKGEALQNRLFEVNWFQSMFPSLSGVMPENWIKENSQRFQACHTVYTSAIVYGRDAFPFSASEAQEIRTEEITECSDVLFRKEAEDWLKKKEVENAEKYVYKNGRWNGWHTEGNMHLRQQDSFFNTENVRYGLFWGVERAMAAWKKV